MDDDVRLVKADGTPSLFKLDFLGMTVLVDHEDRSVIPLSAPTHSLEGVIKYLTDEGFLVPADENQSPRKEENN